MGDEGYVHGAKDPSVERRRLDLLTSLLDPGTFHLLEGLGDLRGWRCLEAGAGTGTVAAWLARRVGAAGTVVATDIDTGLLQDLPASVEVRRHDVAVDDLEPAAFDLVHCRALLVHVPDPVGALARLARAVAPGGWLVVEEPDQTAMRSADPEHPAAATFDRVVHQLLGALEAASRSDQYFGRRVPPAVHRLGLVDVRNTVTASVEVGGSSFASVLGMGATDLAAAVGGTIEASADDIRTALAAFDDPTFSFVRMPVVRTWGRRPS